jgi:hypothetical protein
MHSLTKNPTTSFRKHRSLFDVFFKSKKDVKELSKERKPLQSIPVINKSPSIPFPYPSSIIRRESATKPRVSCVASHQLSDYKKRFRSYNSADVLVVDENVVSMEHTRVKASKIVIKTRHATRDHQIGYFGDDGRNTTVNCCYSATTAIERLLNKGETYALVVVNNVIGGRRGGYKEFVRSLRTHGYKHAIAVIWSDTCTYKDSSDAYHCEVDSVLVHNTKTVTLELTKLVAALSIRFRNQKFKTDTASHSKSFVYSTENENTVFNSTVKVSASSPALSF